MWEEHVFCCCLDKALNTLFSWRWLIVFIFNIPGHSLHCAQLLEFSLWLWKWLSSLKFVSTHFSEGPSVLLAEPSPDFLYTLFMCLISRFHSIGSVTFSFSLASFLSFPLHLKDHHTASDPHCFYRNTKMFYCSVLQQMGFFFLYLEHVFLFHHLDCR